MKQDSYGSIRKIILTCMILVPFIPFVLIVAIGFYHFKASIETSTISNMKRIARDHRQMIESFLNERRNDLEFVHHSYSFDQLRNPDILGQVFAGLQLTSKAYSDLGVFNKSGVHVAYKGPYPLTGKVYKDAPWFKEVMKQGFYISDVFLGFRKIPHFIIAVARDNGQERWVVRATIDSENFCNLVKAVHMGETGEAYILNREGILQTGRRSGGELMEKPTDEIRYPSFQSEIKTFIEKDATGKKFLYATSWLKDGAWLQVVRQEKADAFKMLNLTVLLTGLISVFGGTLIIIVAFYLTHWIVQRMKKIDEEKEQLGHQLIGTSRLAEIGEMATGFAHEINNPLQIIKNEQSLMEMLLAEFKESGELKPAESLTEFEESMEQIDLQISRCSEITQAILKFGRQDEPTTQNIDLKQFIPEITHMIANKAGVHGISLKQDVADDTQSVQGDPARLQQVLINLFNNAMDAIIERHGSFGGELSIKAGPKGDGIVEIVVTDNGSGIRSENLKKVFSPFFTTKPVGKGTGLGLSVCYGIIESMGGEMEVTSKQGAGTTFFIRLSAVK